MTIIFILIAICIIGTILDGAGEPGCWDCRRIDNVSDHRYHRIDVIPFQSVNAAILRLVSRSAVRAEMYARLLEEAYEAAERLKRAHDAGAQIEAPGDEL